MTSDRHKLLWLGFLNAAPMVGYDIASRTWEQFPGNGQWSVTGGTARLVRIPSLDVVVTLYGGGFAVFDYGRTPSWGWTKPPVVGTPPANNRHRTGEWVPELNAIVQWGRRQRVRYAHAACRQSARFRLDLGTHRSRRGHCLGAGRERHLRAILLQPAAARLRR